MATQRIPVSEYMRSQLGKQRSTTNVALLPFVVKTFTSFGFPIVTRHATKEEADAAKAKRLALGHTDGGTWDS